ncbi:MAG: ATP-dependent helicase, partial [Deltaproteobacteria bacterium]
MRLRQHASHLLAHQLMALSIQEGGIATSDWWSWISAATPFQGLSDADRADLVEHMLSEEILLKDGGLLSLGTRGQKLYGFRNFAELYSVFSSPRSMTVMWGNQEIGSVETQFLQSSEGGPVTFTLGARTWIVTYTDWDRAYVRVEPASHGKHARWQGRPRFLHRRLCGAIRELLASRDEDAWWSKRAKERLARCREEHDFLTLSESPLLDEPGGARWWNFAGGAANMLLARMLEARLGEKVTGGNLSIGFRDDAGKSLERVRATLQDMAAEGVPTEADAETVAGGLSRGRMSKFQPCLTKDLEAKYLAEVLLDVEGA